ncbi:hypothetical protein M407DRAFT_91666 [Tulasnella calospora MUT 4182]|uniref:Uncharacterized protein n=1 Tax=Tulasnella calospora MUT 4182 TaxID=1051891 RepID=A0A0C3KVI2_9AGAM|nr:hypothetical protein M407DRAFT_91666 [Tulasnella calospora MUT 4182]
MNLRWSQGPLEEPKPSSRPARPTVITQGEMPDEPPTQSQSTQLTMSLSSEPVHSPGPIPVVRSKKVSPSLESFARRLDNCLSLDHKGKAQENSWTSYTVTCGT